METISIAHIGDIHYADETLKEVDRCFTHAVDQAILRNVDVAVISGDATDHGLDMHSPAVMALAKQIRRLSDHCPVLMLQGTFSHEPPGTLDVFRFIGGKYEVCVVDRICQVMLAGNSWYVSEDWCFDPSSIDSTLLATAVFTCIPTVNKAAVAAVVGASNAAYAVGDHISNLLAGFGPVNLKFAEAGIPTMGVSHGTVNGCLTEHGVPMDGLDHEFTTGSLFSAMCSSFALGHIHAHQSWNQDMRQIAYSGSVGRLHYGEKGAKGFLVWSVDSSSSSFDFVETPARKMIDLKFDGLPDMETIKAAISDTDGAFVRVRWTVDEEHRESVDREAIKTLLGNAEEVKLEGNVLPIVRSRAEGMNQQASFTGKLKLWCATSDTNFDGLGDRLSQLVSMDPEKIVENILAQ